MSVRLPLLALAAAVWLGWTGPASARTWQVAPGGLSLSDALAQAEDGDILEVSGRWVGPFILNKAITLRGLQGVVGEDSPATRAILDGQGVGTVLTVAAPGAVVESLAVRGSGDDLSGPDACIYLTPEATGAIIRGNALEGCAFGIWVHQADGARILNNVVTGATVGHRSTRGNGIQLFDAKHLEVRGNTITGGRDGIYISVTTQSLIAENRMTGTRYGVHYMYAYHNTLRGNIADHNGSGYAVMGSHYLQVEGNRAAYNKEHGLLFRDVQYSHIERNVLLENGEGLFFFSSTENVIKGNRIIGNQVGIKIWAGSVRNQVTENVLRGNRRQVFYVGTEDLVWGKTGAGNFWSDYLGWDQAGDGIGDRPYRASSFTANLLYRYPASALLLTSPALELLAHMEARLPLFRVPTIVDAHPLVRAAEGLGETAVQGLKGPQAPGARRTGAEPAP